MYITINSIRPVKDDGDWEKQSFIFSNILLHFYILPSFLLYSFLGTLQNCKKRLLASSRLSVSPSVCQHGTTQLPLDGFSRNLSVFQKYVEKIQVSLKSDMNNRYFTWRPKNTYGNISLISSWNEKFFAQNLYRNSKHNILCSLTFFLKIVPLMR